MICSSTCTGHKGIKRLQCKQRKAFISRGGTHPLANQIWTLEWARGQDKNSLDGFKLVDKARKHPRADDHRDLYDVPGA